MGGQEGQELVSEREGRAVILKPAWQGGPKSLWARTDLTISVEAPWEVMAPLAQSTRNELLLSIPDLIAVN